MTNFFALYCVSFFRSQMLLLPVLFLFYQENGLTVSDYFFFQGLMTLCTILLEIPIGYISDKISSKYILMVSIILLCCRSLIWLLCRGYYIVLLGEFFYVLSKCSFDAICSAYIYNCLKRNNKSDKINNIYSKLNFIMYFSTALAGILGTYIFETKGYKIVLAIELFCLVLSLYCSVFLPNIKTSIKIKTSSISNRFRKIFSIFKLITHKHSIIPYIFYSGMLVAFSNLFFWSFQPLLKCVNFPIIYFGIIILINNIIRCFFSLFSGKLNNILGLKKFANIVYFLGIICTVLLSFSFYIKQQYFFLTLILYLSLYIGMQLAFTINHICRLQKYAKSFIRYSLSSFNMCISRLCTAILLISAKFLLTYLSVSAILFFTTLCIFIPLGIYYLSIINGKQ